jgi:perosamine synthetase
MIGANPIFVDVESDTLCLDINLVEKAITPKTKAVFLVSANGRYPACGIAAFEALCKKYGLILLEDSAQSLGCFYPDGRHVGTAGLIGSFSFSVPKIITTGQGGALVTNDVEMAKRLRKLKDFGRSGGGNDIHDTIGYNFKFTDVQAAIGIEQMKKLPDRLLLKKQIHRIYSEGLKSIKAVQLFEQDLKVGAPWFIDVLAERRDDLRRHLTSHGIGSRVMYPPINAQKAYGRTGSFPVSERIGREGLWLPSSAQLTAAEVQHICATIRSFYA